MGNKPPLRANYEDVQIAVASPAYVIISVLDESDQSVLIKSTVPCAAEIAAVEAAISSKRNIVVYGRNANDAKAYAKYAQLVKLGAVVHVYAGGMFEWLLLQDIYGVEQFPTNGFTLDHLRYKAPTSLTVKYLTYS